MTFHNDPTFGKDVKLITKEQETLLLDRNTCPECNSNNINTPMQTMNETFVVQCGDCFSLYMFKI